MRVVPPRCQDLAIPLAACCTASVEGGRPLNIISFQWSHIAHNVAKMVCHSVSRRKGPWQIDCQNASPTVTSIPSRAASFQMVWTNEHSKNRWEKSLIALEHITHPSFVFGTKRCRKERVIRRFRMRSQPNTLIFSGIRRLHTRRHRRTSTGSYGGSVARSDPYTSRTVNVEPLHSQASLPASAGHI